MRFIKQKKMKNHGYYEAINSYKKKGRKAAKRKTLILQVSKNKI